MKFVFAALAGCLLLLQGVSSGQALASKSMKKARAVSATESVATGADLSKDIVDTTIDRLPTAAALGEWEYSRALFLLGDLSVYRRTHDPKYLAYAKSWADSHLSKQGEIDRPVDALDFIMPGNVAVALSQETGEERYKLAADHLAEIFKTYPRTSDGAFWHAMDNGREHQLWLDGVYMALPFLTRQGVLAGHRDEATSEAAEQLLLYGSHLRDANGPLYFHAYDESGKAAWADPKTHQSAVKWGRAIGWYCMALVDVLDAMPKSPANAKERAQRQQLIDIVEQLASDLTAFQDPATGLWFQIVDQPKLEGNFLETSASSMFTYFLDVAVKRGYIDASYRNAARRGYEGVLSRVTTDVDGHFHITGICEGTNVGDQASYLTRKVYTDDFHGLGAFLLMNEEVQFNQPAMQEGVRER